MLTLYIPTAVCFPTNPLFSFDAHLLLLFSCYSVPSPRTVAVPQHRHGILVAASHGAEPPPVCCSGVMSVVAVDKRYADLRCYQGKLAFLSIVSLFSFSCKARSIFPVSKFIYLRSQLVLKLISFVFSAKIVLFLAIILRPTIQKILKLDLRFLQR